MNRIKIKENVFLDLYVHENTYLNKKRKMILICPGGGYFFCNKREGEEIALAFLAKGFDASVLYYSTDEDSFYPTQLIELATSVDILHKEYGYSSVILCGFSAGGHLAASLGVLYDKVEVINNLDCRVDGIILSYAVLTSGKYENKRTFDNLCGSDVNSRNWNSLEKRVGKNTPRCFIWHTYEDSLVPVENALNFAAALRENNIPFELHIYEKGPHALSLATTCTAETKEQVMPHVASWFELACEWVENC